jgi:hypothetical protein
MLYVYLNHRPIGISLQPLLLLACSSKSATEMLDGLTCGHVVSHIIRWWLAESKM